MLLDTLIYFDDERYRIDIEKELQILVTDLNCVCIGCTKLILNGWCDTICDHDKVLKRSRRRRIHFFNGDCRCIDFLMVWERNPPWCKPGQKAFTGTAWPFFSKKKKVKSKKGKIPPWCKGPRDSIKHLVRKFSVYQQHGVIASSDFTEPQSFIL